MQCLVKYFIQEEEAPCPLKYDEAMLEEEEDEKDFVLLTSIISEVYIHMVMLEFGKMCSCSCSC